jgi:ankyrin repeat protein
MTAHTGTRARLLPALNHSLLVMAFHPSKGFLTADCKIPIDMQDDVGDTALHDAARFGHVDVIKALLAAGASKAVKNKAGETANEAAFRFEKVGLDVLLA